MAINEITEVPLDGVECGVLIFHVWRKKVPEGIQVLHVCGGNTPTTPAPQGAGHQSETVKNTRFGFDSFLEHCSISNVIVSEDEKGHCRVYVNWDLNSAQLGWNEWGREGNAYKPFLRELFNQSYKNVKIRLDDKKLSVRFSDDHAKGPVETKIVFVAADQESAGEGMYDEQPEHLVGLVADASAK